jgi:hypothetical protein
MLIVKSFDKRRRQLYEVSTNQEVKRRLAEELSSAGNTFAINHNHDLIEIRARYAQPGNPGGPTGRALFQDRMDAKPHTPCLIQWTALFTLRIRNSSNLCQTSGCWGSKHGATIPCNADNLKSTTR